MAEKWLNGRVFIKKGIMIRDLPVKKQRIFGRNLPFLSCCTGPSTATSNKYSKMVRQMWSTKIYDRWNQTIKDQEIKFLTGKRPKFKKSKSQSYFHYFHFGCRKIEIPIKNWSNAQQFIKFVDFGTFVFFCIR